MAAPARRAVSLLFLSLALAACGFSQAPDSRAGARKALVIGSAAYRRLPAVRVAPDRARAVATALRDLKYEVSLRIDTDIAALTTTLRAFLDNIQPGDAVVFYYSGYGVQSASENYLLPVDFPASGGDLYSQAYSVSRLELEMRNKGAQWRVLILDAARSCPELAARFPEPGLAPPNFDADGTLIAYPVPAGKTAQDDPANPLDPFTTALVSALRTPGLTSRMVFDRVLESAPAEKPFVASTVAAEFYMTGTPPPGSAPPETAAVPAAGSLRLNRRDNQEYVFIPSGKFLMGCVSSGSDCRSDEVPRHEVAIRRGFWIGRSEVVVAAYKTYAEQRKSAMPKPPADNADWKLNDFPIVNVTWEDGETFCKWAGGRLPTEAEWEYAARGGQAGWRYPWGNGITHDNANYIGAGGRDQWEQTAPVKRFDPNGWKLFDMAGNVWEWCLDWYDSRYYESSTAADPRGPASGTTHVRRGGSYYSSPESLAIATRGQSDRESENTGFRCVVTEIAQ